MYATMYVRRLLLLQQKQQQHHQKQCWLSNLAESNSSTTTTTTSLSSKPINLISRRLLKQYQQHIQLKQSKLVNDNTNLKETLNKNKKKEETTSSWPRNVVYTFYVVTAISIPYSIAWFLSTNEPIRTMIFPSSEQQYHQSSSSSSLFSLSYYQFTILQWMRYHFGIPDYECISEPERVHIITSSSTTKQNMNDKIPYKFMDEPTKRIRIQQYNIDQIHHSNIKCRLYSNVVVAGVNDNTNENSIINYHPSSSTSTSLILELPAKTLARYDHIVKALPPGNISITPPIALDFINYDEEVKDVVVVADDFDTSSSSAVSDLTITVPSMSIYSLWHYQPPKDNENEQQQQQRSSSSSTRNHKTMSPIDIELSRINYEIHMLQNELKQQQQHNIQQRPIDDINDDLYKLQKEKRKLLKKKYWIW